MGKDNFRIIFSRAVAMFAGVQLADTLEEFYHGEYGKAARSFIYFIVHLSICVILMLENW